MSPAPHPRASRRTRASHGALWIVPILCAVIAPAAGGDAAVAAGETEPSPDDTTAFIRVADSVGLELDRAGLFEYVAATEPDYNANVYYVFATPDRVAQLQRALESLSGDIAVKVSPAVVTEADLHVANRLIPRDGVLKGALSGVEINADASGLIVELHGERDEVLIAAVQKSLADAPFPFAVEFTGSQSKNMFTAGGGGRDHDLSPYFGGAVIGPREGGSLGTFKRYCSSGAYATLRTTDEPVMVTAQHCTEAYGATWYSGANRLIGNNVSGSALYDSTFIRPADGYNLSHKIYTGSYLATTYRDVAVGFSPADHPTGDTVYLSGGWRGQATLTITSELRSVDITDEYGNYLRTIYGQYQAESANGLRTNGTGDSGSPIYTVHSNGTDAVIRGILTSVEIDRYVYSCSQGDMDWASIACGNVFYFTGANQVEAALDADF